MFHGKTKYGWIGSGISKLVGGDTCYAMNLSTTSSGLVRMRNSSNRINHLCWNSLALVSLVAVTDGEYCSRHLLLPVIIG